MAIAQDDPRNKLQALFQEVNRHANYGDVLVGMRVRGFRGHQATTLDFRSPITAICGLNGSGKSTLLQLAAVAYQSATANALKYYVNDFIVAGRLDLTPFTSDALVEYTFGQADGTAKKTTLSRNTSKRGGWKYPDRPSRDVLFVGVGHYVPKTEQPDFFMRNSTRMVITSSANVTQRVKDWTARILGSQYNAVRSNTVSYAKRSGTLVSVERFGMQYSEANMGYGEGRTQRLLSQLESLPCRSLVLLEEPETSLHASAQQEIGRYLVDLCIEKRHQIILTTHSEYILQALPAASRVYLYRTESGTDVLEGLSSLQAKSLMSQGGEKALHVLVEDDVAQAVLTEIIRKYDAQFLSSVRITAVGDATTVEKVVRTLNDKKAGVEMAGVRDADQGVAPKINLYKLPGRLPPEKELLANSAVKEYLAGRYHLIVDDFMASTLQGLHHHKWFDALAQRVVTNEAALVTEVARVYVEGLTAEDSTHAQTLVEQLREAITK